MMGRLIFKGLLAVKKSKIKPIEIPEEHLTNTQNSNYLHRFI